MPVPKRTMKPIINTCPGVAEHHWKRSSLSLCNSECRSVLSDSLQPHGLYSPWNSLGQNTGVVAFPFSRGSSQRRDRTQVSLIAGRFFISRANKEARTVFQNIFQKVLRKLETLKRKDFVGVVLFLYWAVTKNALMCSISAYLESRVW